MKEYRAVVELRGKDLEKIRTLKNVYEDWKRKGTSFEDCEKALEPFGLESGFIDSVAKGLLKQILIDCDSFDDVEVLKITMEVSAE